MTRLVDGTLLVTDTFNATIRSVAPDGTVSTIAGVSGSQAIIDGPPGTARLNVPSDIAPAPNGGAYFIDQTQSTPQELRVRWLLRHVAADGTVTTLSAPVTVGSVATNASGQVILSTRTALYEWTPAGTKLLAGLEGASGTTDGAPSDARFFEIADVAVADDGTIYASDPRTHTLRRLRAGRVDTFAGVVSSLGSVDGVGAAARLSSPGDLSLDAQGQLWVAEIGSGRFRRVTPDGAVSTPFGADRSFFKLNTSEQSVAIAAGASGELIFSSFAGVNRLDATGVVTPIAGQDYVTGTLDWVRGIGVDGAGNIVVEQQTASPGYFSPPYSVTRYTAAGQQAGTTVGLPPTLEGVHGFTVAADGNAYASSVTTRGGGINVEIATGGSITRIAPDGSTSALVTWTAGAVGAMAPGFLTLGRDGAFYFIDLITFNLVRWTPSGGAKVLAPTPFYLLLFPPAQTITADAQGRVHLVTARGVQRVQDGALVTVAGDIVERGIGQAGNADGQGTAARFTSARAATVDAAGNLYIADWELVRMMTPDGLVTTVAGTRGRIGLAPGALPGTLAINTRIAVADDGTLYVLSGTALVKIRR